MNRRSKTYTLVLLFFMCGVSTSIVYTLVYPLGKLSDGHEILRDVASGELVLGTNESQIDTYVHWGEKVRVLDGLVLELRSYNLDWGSVGVFMVDNKLAGVFLADTRSRWLLFDPDLMKYFSAIKI